MSVFNRHDRTIRLELGDEETLQAPRRGWHLGSDTFRQEQLARMEGKLGQHHAGELRRETAEARLCEVIGLGAPTNRQPQAGVSKARTHLRLLSPLSL